MSIYICIDNDVSIRKMILWYVNMI